MAQRAAAEIVSRRVIVFQAKLVETFDAVCPAHVRTQPIMRDLQNGSSYRR